MPDEKKSISSPMNLEDFFRPVRYANIFKHKNFPEGLPYVEPAPQFRKNAFPLVVGQPENARLVEKILDEIPEARGHFNKVMFGPTGGVIQELLRSKMSPYDFENSNLLGLTDHNAKDIAVRPGIDSPEYSGNGLLLRILVHEMKHSHDRSNEEQAQEASNYYPKDMELNRYRKILP